MQMIESMAISDNGLALERCKATILINEDNVDRYHMAS